MTRVLINIILATFLTSCVKNKDGSLNGGVEAGVYESENASSYSAVKVVDDTISVFVFYTLPEDVQMKILNKSGPLLLREKIIGRKVAADSNSVTYKIERASCESTIGYTIKVSLSNGELTLEDVPMLNLKIDGGAFKQFVKSDKTADWDRVAEDMPEDKKSLIAETCFGRVGEDYSLRIVTE